MASKIYKVRTNKNRWINYQKAVARKIEYNKMIRSERKSQKTKRNLEKLGKEGAEE